MAIVAADTAWVLIASALVLFMLPGLALFYGGMVRRKNVLSSMMHSFVAMSIIAIEWVIIGYSLAFGTGNWFIGDLEHVFLQGIDLNSISGTIPTYAFIVFQGMFAIITPALIIGAFVERMKFGAFLIFTVLWGTFVYAPVCHWVWGGGWIGKMGALDFAGGTVVHINAGIAALVTALIIGKRKNGTHAPTPHNLPLTVIGAALLWFGWFGFNAGSELAADGVAVSAFVVTAPVTDANSNGISEADERSSKSTSKAKITAAMGVVKIEAIAPAAPQPIKSVLCL